MTAIIKKVDTGGVVHYIVDTGQTHICHTLDEVFALMSKLFVEAPRDKKPEEEVKKKVE